MPLRASSKAPPTAHEAARAIDTSKHWGAPPGVCSTTLSRPVQELQAELVALAADMRRGPLAHLLAEATSYLGELRREFLRVHRRLVVAIQTDDDAELGLDRYRTELAEVNERLRSVVLGRASRMSAEGWHPSGLMTALERTLEVLPDEAEADLEPMRLQKNASDPVHVAFARALVRGWVRLRRALGGHPRRTVDLQALARFHLSGMPVERLEGVAALFLQAEAQLVGHSRLILDGIARGLDTVREHASEADLQDVLATFKQQVEEEFSLAEGEIERLVDDGGQRVVKVLGEGLRGLKADLPIAGTFELPTRKRRAERILSAQSIALEDLDRRLERARRSIAASYVLLGMHLEYASYRARVRVVLGRKLTELKKDVRGRSHTQIERVLASLQEVMGAITDEAPDPDSEQAPEPKENLRDCLEPLERVLTEALRNANQLLEQLSEEQLVAPLLDALIREAQGLTDRYEVPAGRLPHAEWRLPPPLATVEVRLAELLTAYIQTEVAPELLSVTQAAVSGIQPVVSAFHDLERVVGIDAEAFVGDVEVSLSSEDPAEGQRVVVRAALERSRAALEEARERSQSWPDGLVEQLKQVVFQSVDALRESLSEAQVGDLRGARARAVRTPHALTEQVDRITGLLNRVGEDSTRAVRRLLGERRLAGWRRQLGLPDADSQHEDTAAYLAAPGVDDELPLFYRRLFASNAYWATDLLPEQRQAVERVQKVLGRGRGRGLRSAAVLSVDGAGQGALLAAISRGDRLAQVRRISFARPVTTAEVDALFAELGRGELVVVGGLQWLLSAKPGGYEPVRAFLAGVIADAGNNAWLVESSTLVWRYACRIAPVGDVFSEVVTVGALTADDLEAALRARHQLSGLEARFGGADDDEGAEIAARERYFASLHDVSGGHLAQALPAWVASIDSVDEDAGVVRLGRPPPSARPALERLDEETQVILHAASRQGWLDADTLAYLFRWTPVGARGRLMRLVSDGLLEQKSGGLYQIRRHLRHGVQAVLQQRGWI